MGSASHVPEFRFERIGDSRFDLLIEGPLPLGWAATIAANLSKRGFDVDTARARQDAEGAWYGRIQGKRPLGLANAPSADELLAPLADVVAVIPQVIAHATEASDSGSALEVTIRAGDAVGLLATLLRCFGMLGLFPRSFDVRTVAGEADDRFVLSGIGGSAVSDRAAREVERALARWQTRTSSDSVARPS